jgi:ADP-ribose pyrophosphatase YjhB (NUDIX family)
MEKMESLNNFNVVVIGIIFDPAKKKILIGKRENDPHLESLEWCFPGGRLNNGEEVDKALKLHVKKKTGYEVKNLGAIFSKVMNEKPNMLTVYFLTEVFRGEESPGDGIKELKWVDPEELEGLFKTSFNSRLKEYLISLK